LQLCGQLGLWANVEIKPSAGCEAETGVVVARQAAAALGPLILSSFSLAALVAAAAAAPQLPRALLVKDLPPDWRERVKQSGAIAVHAAAQEMNAAAAQAVTAAGFPLACYTVNRREDADRLFAMDIAAVFTDRPDLWSPGEM
jgi:glycerophosphoryl diester phosphodiesterase